MTDQLPVLHTPAAPVLHTALSAAVEEAQWYAKAADAVPKTYRGNVGAVLLAMHWGLKRDMDPLTAMQAVSFVQGRPVIDATMLRALARQAGYRVLVESASTQQATVAVREGGKIMGEVIGRATFTMDDAKRAGLAGKDNWKNYAEDMLVARATARAIRRYAPDVMVGIALPDEVDNEAPSLGRELYREPDIDGVPIPPEIVASVEVDNGGPPDAGTTETEATTLPLPPTSQHEAMTRPVLVGRIRATIDALSKPQKARLRSWMARRPGGGWKLDDLSVVQLEAVQQYLDGPVAAMLPPDEPEPEPEPDKPYRHEVNPVTKEGWKRRHEMFPPEPEPAE